MLSISTRNLDEAEFAASRIADDLEKWDAALFKQGSPDDYISNSPVPHHLRPCLPFVL
jgi:hypothetical protein